MVYQFALVRELEDLYIHRRDLWKSFIHPPLNSWIRLLFCFHKGLNEVDNGIWVSHTLYVLSQWSLYSLNYSDPAYSNIGLCGISMQDCIYVNILLTIIIFVFNVKYYNTAVPKTLAVNRTDSVSQQ